MEKARLHKNRNEFQRSSLLLLLNLQEQRQTPVFASTLQRNQPEDVSTNNGFNAVLHDESSILAVCLVRDCGIVRGE